MPTGIRENVPLATHTTLGVGGAAEFFTEVTTIEDLRHVLAWAKERGHPVTILGGGSNVLVPDEGVRGLVVRPDIFGIRYEDRGEHVRVHAGAGVVLDELIQALVERDLWGMENLSGIPGTVGAVPVQNVGAYGVEANDVIEHVHVYDIHTDTERDLTANECEFGYRDSIFKKEKGKRYVITGVTFRPVRVPTPKLSYTDLRAHFAGRETANLREVREAILSIRGRKFPDWNTIGTAGSFFKNPTIPADSFRELRGRYPNVPGYPGADGSVKVPLGWVLDKVCNLRGYTEGKIKLFEAQALVLVCERGASATEIDLFARKIADVVREKTGIVIEREVTMLR